MTYAQVSQLLKQTSLSPEELGNEIGISGMTIRRWLKRPRAGVVDRAYVPAIREACYRMVSSGKVDGETQILQSILAEGSGAAFEASMFHLGFGREMFEAGEVQDDQFIAGLSRLGSDERRRSGVDTNEKKILSFKELSKEWGRRVSMLWDIVISKKLSSIDKLVAYGALFYLLTPLDLIPDHIPGVGLCDDFGVLGIAASYYLNRHSGSKDASEQA